MTSTYQGHATTERSVLIAHRNNYLAHDLDLKDHAYVFKDGSSY